MLNNIHDSFVYFWECITGVLEDNKARMLRFSVFITLFIGIIWAAWNYFEVSVIGNTNEEGDYFEREIRAQRAVAENENETLKKIADLAATVNDMRNGGFAIAEAMNGMNRRLFNIDGFNEFGMENLSGTGDDFFKQVNATPSQSVQGHEEKHEVHEVAVRAIMLSEKSKLAVVDADGKKGIIISVGSELHGGAGRVVQIKSNGLTVRNSSTKQEIEYLIK